jgi:hypothetical protein
MPLSHTVSEHSPVPIKSHCAGEDVNHLQEIAVFLSGDRQAAEPDSESGRHVTVKRVATCDASGLQSRPAASWRRLCDWMFRLDWEI